MPSGKQLIGRINREHRRGKSEERRNRALNNNPCRDDLKAEKREIYRRKERITNAELRITPCFVNWQQTFTFHIKRHFFYSETNSSYNELNLDTIILLSRGLIMYL